MAAKNVHKINSLHMIGLAKRIPKDCYPQSSKPSKKLPAADKGDFSQLMSKSSPTSLIGVSRAAGRNAWQRYENRCAVAQVRKCNEILKEQFYQKRQIKETLMSASEQNRMATLSQKLMEIMSLDVANTGQLHQFQRLPPGHQQTTNSKDLQPQANRMDIPIHSVKQNQDVDERNLYPPEDKAVLSHRRYIKPAPKAISKKELDQSIDSVMTVKDLGKTTEMWTIGDRLIPRLY